MPDYYVVLDLEWNQPVCSQLMRHDPVTLSGEIIEFGAVRITADGRPLDTFKTLVSPKFYKKMHSRVARMTGITTAMLQNAPTFPAALERFAAWCAQMGDFAFLTWGPDDIPMLRTNMKMHGLDESWIPAVYNLQILFNRQITGENRQWSLTAAAERLEIAQRWSAHDALHDALYTAIIAGKLDLRGGIESYSKSPEPSFDGSLEKLTIERKVPVELGNFFSDREISEVTCPECGSRGSVAEGGWIPHGPGRRIAAYTCPDCGKHYFLRCRFGRGQTEVFTAIRTLNEATEETDAILQKALEKKQSGRSSSHRRRSHHRRKKAEAPSEA